MVQMLSPEMVTPDTVNSAAQTEMQSLLHRLREGEEAIRRAKKDGTDPDKIRRWESAWIGLLRQYEILCDRQTRQQAARAETVMETESV